MWPRCGKTELCVFVGFLCVCTLCLNSTGISAEVHRNSFNSKIISPEFRQNIELERLKQKDDHNSAFPQAPVFDRLTAVAGAGAAESLVFLAPPLSAAPTTCSRRRVIGWHYLLLSGAACLMRPHLLFVLFVVSRVIMLCYIMKHF